MIKVAVSTFMEYNDYGDFVSDGIVQITCLKCHYDGWTDVDADRYSLHGDCPECGEGFEVAL